MDQQHTLAAIVFTDIVGYTTLMGKSESEAMEILELNRKRHDEAITRHNGKKIKEIGDGIMMIFPSASNAVACALDLHARQDTYKLRIGIHLSEVIESEGDVFGDGVNIASRIEQIAPPGGIYVSGAVYDSVRNQTSAAMRLEGDIDLKNVASMVRIYSLAASDEQLPDRSHFHKRTGKKVNYTLRIILGVLFLMAMTFVGWFIAGKPFLDTREKTIAILPFEYVGDASQTYLSTGITENILNQLLKVHELRVIDRSNLRSYSYEDKSFKEIGTDLRVENILVGTVNRESENIIVTARLIDASSEQALWSDIFNKPYQDIFALQSEVAISIADALKAEISDSEQTEIEKTPTTNIDAVDLYWKGREYYGRYTEADNLSAIELFRQAIALDSTFVMAYAGLSDAFSQLAQKSNQSEQYLDSARWYAERVLQFDPDNSDGHKAMGLYFSIEGQTEKAIMHFQKAVQVNNNAAALINLTRLYYRTGKLMEALHFLEQSEWSSPMNADVWFNFGATYYRLQEFAKADEYLDKALFINPNHINSLLLKWFLAVLVSNDEEAFTTAQKLGVIAGDDSDKLMILLQEVVQHPETAASRAQEVYDVMGERELDYANLPTLYNLISFTYFKGNLQSRARALFQYKYDQNMQRIIKGDKSYRLPYEIAQIHSMLGNTDEAVTWLERAYKAGWMEYSYATVDPCFRNLQDNQQFLMIIQKAIGRIEAMKLENTSANSET